MFYLISYKVLILQQELAVLILILKYTGISKQVNIPYVVQNLPVDKKKTDGYSIMVSESEYKKNNGKKKQTKTQNKNHQILDSD